MKIHIKNLGKQILAAAMAGVLLVSSAGAESVFAAQEDVNEEAVFSPEKMEEETAEEIGVEEHSAEMNENLGGGVEINEQITDCEVVEPNGASVELKAGQTATLPTIVMGDSFSAAITSNGDLYCWGRNDSGQVGDGTTEKRTTPVKVLSEVSSVSVSRCGTIAAIKSNGDLYCWGDNHSGQVGNETSRGKRPAKVLSEVSSVSVSRYGTMAALKSNGDLYCWGYNYCGQVGNGSVADQTTPVKVLEQVASIFVYAFDTMAAIKSNGDLYCWGGNDSGQVGNGTTTNQTTPVKVLSEVASVSIPDSGVACSTMAAITSNGDLYCWGRNDSGQVGDGTTENQSRPVKVLDQVSSIYGHNTMAAIKSNGDLYCWGDNSYGQVGSGSVADQTTPVKVLDQVSSIYDSGDGSTNGTIAAIKSNGDLYCWGVNDSGQVGNGTTTDQTTPIKVLDQVSSVSGYIYDFENASGTMAAITSNGDLYCWGDNSYGQVGNGSITNQTTPIKVLDQIFSVCSYSRGYGSATMIAIKSNGDLYYWGYNYCGQASNGSSMKQLIPVKIMNLVNGNLDPLPGNNTIASFTLPKTASGTFSGDNIVISGTLTLSDDADTSVDIMESQISGITWTSSDSSVAEVTNCKGVNSVDNRLSTLLITVTPYKAGTTTITGTTSNGLTASCEVTVKNKEDKEDAKLVTITGDNTYYYWDNCLYGENDKACNSIPLKVTVNNTTGKDMENIIVEMGYDMAGLCFDNKDTTIKYELESLAIGEKKTFQLNLSLDDFEHYTHGTRYSTVLSVSLRNKDEEDIYNHEEFELNIAYLFDFDVDNFSFLNEDKAFWDSNNEKKKYYISDAAKKRLSLENYIDICGNQGISNVFGWKGSCHGMSSVISTAFAGVISSKQFGESSISRLKPPVSNILLRDTINILHLSQITLDYISNANYFLSQKELAEKIVTALKTSKETHCLPVIKFKIDVVGNHAIVPYSISEKDANYNIWVYDPNYTDPKRLTISKDYKTISYETSKNVELKQVHTNLKILDINTYAPGLLSESNAHSAVERAYISEKEEDTQYDFTTVLMDTSEEVILSNSASQILRVKGEEILDGDMAVRDISYLADMDNRLALIVLENDSTGIQELQIQSNINNKITALINNNHSVGFINTEGDNHTATYSSEGEILVRSDGKIAGEVSYSNLELIKNTDAFSASLSGKNASNMDITAKGGTLKVYSDNLKNMSLTMERKGEDYYVTDFPLENTDDSSTGVEITQSDNDIIFNETDTAIPAVTIKPLPPTSQKNEQILDAKYTSELVKTVGSKFKQRITGANTEVTFTSSDPDVVKVNKTSGKITCVKVGEAVITAEAAESDEYKAASTQVTITVIPKKAGIQFVVSNRKGQVIVKSTNKAKGNTGYQIQYKNNGETKSLRVKSRKTITKVIKGLKSGKSLWVRIRAYKRVNGKTYFGNYSSWKTLKRVR